MGRTQSLSASLISVGRACFVPYASSILPLTCVALSRIVSSLATSSQAWMNKTGKAHCAPPIHHTKSSDQSDAVLLPNNPEGPQPVAYPSASDALDRS